MNNIVTDYDRSPDEKNIKKARNTNVEIVRILAALMIIVSHIFTGTDGGKSFKGIPQVICVFFQSSFNANLGVMLFMIISGYYLVKCSQKKLVNMISITWCCSIFSLGLKLLQSKFLETYNFKATLPDIVGAFIPVSSKHYWYMSCYIFLMILSPFINKAIEKISKRDYTRLLIAMIVLFFALPTFVYFDIMGDRGKGLITMVCAYFIGAYLSKYKIQIRTKTGILGIAALTLITFAGNMAATFARNKITSYPFSRECTLTVLGTAVMIVLLATKSERSNKFVNKISSRVIYVYLIGGGLTAVFTRNGFLQPYHDKLWFAVIVFAVAIFVFIESTLFSYIVGLFVKLLNIIINKFIDIGKSIFFKLKGKMLKK